MRWSILPLLVLLASEATAQGSVLVKGRAALRVTTQKTAPGVTVVVELRDELNSLIEEEATLTLTIEGRTQLQQAIGGIVRFPLTDLSFGSYQAVLRFAGSERYGEAQETLQIDIQKETPALLLEAPAELSLNDTEGVLLARLEIEEIPLPGEPLTLSGLRGDSKRATTGPEGTATFLMSPKDLPREGPNDLRISFGGNNRYNAVSSTQTINLVVPVVVTIQGPAEASADDEVEIEGTLSTPFGPLGEHSIGLYARVAKGEERSLGGAVSDAEGRFTATLAAKAFKSGAPVELLARYQPDTPWNLPAESDPITVQIRPPRPVPAAFYLLPLFVCGAIALGMFMLRRVRRAVIKAPEARPKGGVFPVVRANTGPEQRTLQGTVTDAATQQPLLGARVLLLLEGGGEREVRSDARGAFFLDDLAAGHPSLRVEARGYVSEEVRVEIPHRGRWSGFTVALLPVREKVLELFRIAAIQVLPEKQLFGSWTPREIRRYARDRRHSLSGPIAELVKLFESVYFAGVIGDEETVAQAKELSDQALASTPAKPS